MNNIVSANELKTKGVSVIQNEISKNQEVIISVRGKNKFVVLPIEEYNRLREYELTVAIEESKKDLKSGKIIKESVEKHIKRITNG